MSLGARPQTPPTGITGNHFSCSMTAVLLGRVVEHGGEAAVAEVLRVAESRRSAAYLSDIANWICFDEAIALMRAGSQVTHHPQFARAVGEDAARWLNASPVAALLRSLGSPEVVYGQIATTATKYSTATTLEQVDSGPGFATIVATATPGFPRAADHCAWTCGLLSQPTILFGLPPATVHHEVCAAYGAPTCQYHVTWPIETDAVAAESSDGTLRGQLDAMTVRLDSMFQTASDLIGSGSVDEVLARIADRAAVEVRAPRHLLAVRTTPDGPLHCHHKGFDPTEVQEHAERLLSADPVDLPDSWLVVPVRSNRREYGRLLAICEAGTRFFPQERELLSVYARYAATALDSATALLEAEERYAQSSALLELARAVAAAGTSAEVARRLADAVPMVVDCDRVGVYLWDAARNKLVRQAYAPPQDGTGPMISGESSWTPAPGGAVEQFLSNPNRDPVFIDADGGQLGTIFSGLGFTSTVVVPLAAPGQLLGLLTVSVRDRPERLKSSPDLLDRLSGVAAHATTALQNGQLIDMITHQALHDQLTGLANRLQFTTELRAAVHRARMSGERGALFYVDLDQFKPVNDEFGHETGDALLVAVAERLKHCTRATDVVARLGGDEFAVLLAGAGEPEIESVSRRIIAAFREPFLIGEHSLRLGVSIGHSRYPLEADDADGLLRQADTAMFVDKRAHQADRAMVRQPQPTA
jgi:diguanylate cyclase (GGDEF)-like protein